MGVVMDRSFDALLCDVDGVVRHWDKAAIAGLEQEYGLAAGTFAAVAFAPARLMPALTGRISDEQWRADVAHHLTVHCGSSARASRFVQLWSEPLGRVDDEVLQLLVRARRSIAVALISNATTRLERDLQVLGVTDVVPLVVSSARVGSAKPDPAIYRAGAERVGVPVSRCLFVDDTPENVHAARALGMTGLVYREPADLRTALGPVLA
jgi:putative hydrolase of the HAD superfamily